MKGGNKREQNFFGCNPRDSIPPVIAIALI